MNNPPVPHIRPAGMRLSADALKGETMELDYDSLYVGGEWITPASSSKVTVVSASTEQVIGHVPQAVQADIDAAVGAARRAYDDPNGWAHWEPAQRAAAMERLASALDTRAGEMVRRISSQNGMPVAVGNQLEAVFPALVLRYYAGLVKDDTFEEIRPGLLGGTTLVRREPLGVVGAIVPWNFPQTLAFMKLAPALAAGSTEVGRSIAETCGRLFRPVTLELGGKSAGIVLDDADLDLAKIAQQMFTATLLNNGQTCFLSTRVLAPRSRYGEIVDIFSGLAGALKVGDPLDASTQIGPMVSERQRQRVEGYIAKGRGEGARITAGGGRPKGLDKGWFVEPTIFADVDNSHTIAQEEIFGPVLSVIPYSDVDEAVSIANASDCGLGGTVWTTDHDRGVEVAKRVQTGSIGINNYLPDPTAPCGGVKSSGLGRELGPEGLAAYLNFKSIYLPVK